MTTTPRVQIGTISHGTLRTEDLLQAFADAVYDASGNVPFASHVMLVRRAEALLESNTDLETSEEASQTVADLQDALQEYAPPWCYFGAIEGDGSDFGFWVDLDSLSEALRYEGGEIEEGRYELDGYTVVISDHGNVTLLDSEGSAVWAVV